MQHFLQFSQVIGTEALFSALHDKVQVGITDVIVINVLLGRAQAVPRRIFVYIAAILVYKATDTIADTEQGESRFARALKSAMTEMKRSLST